MSYYALRKWIGCLAITALMVSLIACGDDVTRIESETNFFTTLPAGETPAECSRKNAGEMFYVTDSAAFYYCNAEKWIILESSSKDTVYSKDTVVIRDTIYSKDSLVIVNTLTGLNGTSCTAIDTIASDGRTGYMMVCGDSLIGAVWNGRDGVNGVSCIAADTVSEEGFTGYKITCGDSIVGAIWNGRDGTDGESCTAADTVSEEGIFGLNVICGSENVGSIWNGKNGIDGDPCYIKKLEAGYEINCGTDNIVDLYNGFCGTTPYDPAGNKFCYGVNLYDKCNGEAYDVTKKFCYDNTSIEDLCGTSSYNLSTQFCYNSKVYAKCNGKSYNPSQWTCSNNKATKTVTFKAHYKKSCSNAECDGAQSTFTLGSTVTIPAGVSAVAMTVKGSSIASYLSGTRFNITIGSVTKTITVTSSLGSTVFTVSPTSATYSYSSPLSSATNVSGKVTYGKGQDGDFSGSLTFTYTP